MLTYGRDSLARWSNAIAGAFFIYLIATGKGFDIGVGPTVVVVDAGVAKSLTTTTMKDIHLRLHFDQKGLMPGFGL